MAIREIVRVKFHLSEGYTKVIVETTEGVGLADGGVFWDVPTWIIPEDLRQIGSRFFVIEETSSTTADSQRSNQLRVERIIAD